MWFFFYYKSVARSMWCDYGWREKNCTWCNDGAIQTLRMHQYVYTCSSNYSILFLIIRSIGDISLVFFQLSVFYTNNARANFYTTSVKYIGHIRILSFRREILIDSSIIFDINMYIFIAFIFMFIYYVIFICFALCKTVYLYNHLNIITIWLFAYFFKL